MLYRTINKICPILAYYIISCYIILYIAYSIMLDHIPIHEIRGQMYHAKKWATINFMITDPQWTPTTWTPRLFGPIYTRRRSKTGAYHTIPYHTILYYTILYYTILYYTILYYTILYYTIPYYSILYYTILYYTILYYTIPYYTILFDILYDIL